MSWQCRCGETLFSSSNIQDGKHFYLTFSARIVCLSCGEVDFIRNDGGERTTIEEIRKRVKP